MRSKKNINKETNEKPRVHFLANLISIWMKFSKLPQQVGVLKLMLNLLCTSNIKGVGGGGGELTLLT